MPMDESAFGIQKSKIPNIQCYEDVVVYSDRLSRNTINALALQFSETIRHFEEIVYISAYLYPETLETLCAQHAPKVKEQADIRPLAGIISTKTYQSLQDRLQHNAGM